MSSVTTLYLMVKYVNAVYGNCVCFSPNPTYSRWYHNIRCMYARTYVCYVYVAQLRGLHTKFNNYIRRCWCQNQLWRLTNTHKIRMHDSYLTMKTTHTKNVSLKIYIGLRWDSAIAYSQSITMHMFPICNPNMQPPILLPICSMKMQSNYSACKLTCLGLY